MDSNPERGFSYSNDFLDHKIAFNRGINTEEQMLPLLDPLPSVDKKGCFSGASMLSSAQKRPLVSSASLCKLCQSITKDALENECGYAHHESGRELLATEGNEACCSLCALVLQTLRKAFLSPDWDDEAKRCEFTQRMEQDSEQIILFAHFPHKIEIRHNSSLSWSKRYGSLEPSKRFLYLYTRHDKPNHHLTKYHLPCKDSLQTMQLLMRWMKTCLMNHDECPKPGGDLMPSRLIDVESSLERHYEAYLWINPQSARNAEDRSSEVQLERGTYAALSYCWGTQQLSTTTPSTLAARKRAIPMHLLPETIRDAILVTRLLGIRFLWVDALCILQGPSDEARRDWISESAKMDSIYNSAILTIGAAYGHDAHTGLFARPRSPKLPYCCLPTHQFDTNSPGPLYAGPVVGSEPDEWPFWLQNMEQMPLSKRAWTLQERVLSSRMVFFQMDQICWECKYGQEFERGDPWRRPESKGYSKRRLKLGQTYQSWNILVVDYSSRQLTFSTDKLSALAGLAKAFWLNNGQQDEYLGGVWRDSLPRSLLWCVSDHRLIVLEPDQPNPCAPSWSWASVDQEIQYFQDDMSNQNDIETLGCQTSAEDPFGPVVRAKLVVRGSMKRGRMVLPSDRDDRCYHLCDETTFTLNLDDPVGFVYNDHSASSKEIAEARMMDPRHGWPKSLEVHCLLVLGNSGLLLTPTAQEGDKYKRVGYFYLLRGHLDWFDCQATQITII